MSPVTTHAGVRPMVFLAILIASVALLVSTSTAQTGMVTVLLDVNLRPDPSTEYAPIRLLKPGEPQMELLEPHEQDGYYHVQTSSGETGYVWAKNVHVSAAPPTPTPNPSPNPTLTPIPTPGPGVPGSSSMVGCGDSLWEHVYHPTRLLVQQDCVIVSGVIMDATANETTHQPDGVRHEPDGDTHGWLKVDPMFANLINAGNTSHEGGYLVFEIVCHYPVRQTDAGPSCAGFADNLTIPPVGSHVTITGTLVTETNHARWNEIHPVTSIKVH